MFDVHIYFGNELKHKFEVDEEPIKFINLIHKNNVFVLGNSIYVKLLFKDCIINILSVKEYLSWLYIESSSIHTVQGNCISTLKWKNIHCITMTVNTIILFVMSNVTIGVLTNIYCRKMVLKEMKVLYMCCRYINDLTQNELTVSFPTYTFMKYPSNYLLDMKNV